MEVTTKFEITKRFLENRHPRYANQASIKMVADGIGIGEKETIAVEFADQVIPTDQLEEAFLRVESRLADNYEGPISAFFENHPEFYRHQANKKFVEDALASEGVVVPTEEDFTLLLDEGNPNGVAGILQKSEEAVQAENDEHARQNLIRQILTDAPPLVTGSTDRDAERSKALARDQWIERIKSSSIDDLQRIYAKQQLKSGSVEDVRQVVKHASSQQALYDQRFKPLPEFFEVPGKDQKVPMTKQFLAHLPATEISRLIRIYGEEAINARLQGRS